ncbi:hypothetical protein Sjap_024492 [Stephania japonica]|uniref:Uncharacterized protein n=1 Tax=Stephania japonica TaxID=461633 RepID=A0AAP0EDH2_9MAGN
MRELQLASAAKTFDESSMERSKSFIKALQVMSDYVVLSFDELLVCSDCFELLDDQIVLNASFLLLVLQVCNPVFRFLGALCGEVD